MKKNIVNAAAAVILLAGVLIIAGVKLNAFGIDKSASSSVKYKLNGDSRKEACCSAEPAGKYTDNSIYQYGAVWTDQSGRKITLGNFKGKRIVLAMFYASCTTACPELVNDIQQLERKIPKSRLDSFRFILVTIDPHKDTPSELFKYAGSHDLDLNRWSLLRGSKEEVATLAQLIGFQYKRNSSGMFTHTNLITFLNAQGEITKQSEGLNQNIDNLLQIAENKN